MDKNQQTGSFNKYQNTIVGVKLRAYQGRRNRCGKVWRCHTRAARGVARFGRVPFFVHQKIPRLNLTGRPGEREEKKRKKGKRVKKKREINQERRLGQGVKVPKRANEI